MITRHPTPVRVMIYSLGVLITGQVSSATGFFFRLLSIPPTFLFLRELYYETKHRAAVNIYLYSTVFFSPCVYTHTQRTNDQANQWVWRRRNGFVSLAVVSLSRERDLISFKQQWDPGGNEDRTPNIYKIESRPSSERRSK